MVAVTPALRQGPLHPLALYILLSMARNRHPTTWWPYHLSSLLELGYLRPLRSAAATPIRGWPWILTPAARAWLAAYAP